MRLPSLTWDVDPVLLPGGARPLRWYVLFLAASLIGGFFLWRWQMRRRGHDELLAARALPYALVSVIVGARLGHCLFYDLERTLADPLFVFALWRGGLASHGAALGLVFGLWLYARRERLPLAEVFDSASFGCALGATLVRVGNLFNSEIVGRLTDQSWGVRFPRFDVHGVAPLRHPSQIYEALLGAAVLALLLWVQRRWPRHSEGLLGALFVTSYFAGRVVVERFKAHQTLAPDALLTMGQWLSIAPLAAGALWLVLIARRARAR
ncbi:MAG: prolipoprotein diacylglyceryl transferase [Myxococcales bacterium]|nr:prolipoprotein diacylglyceryl transferase [Myxococcales bacterium]